MTSQCMYRSFPQSSNIRVSGFVKSIISHVQVLEFHL